MNLRNNYENLYFCWIYKTLEELDFDYVVVDKTFNDLTPQLIDKYSDKIIWNETNSDIRWIRIAKQLLNFRISKRSR